MVRFQLSFSGESGSSDDLNPIRCLDASRRFNAYGWGAEATPVACFVSPDCHVRAAGFAGPRQEQVVDFQYVVYPLSYTVDAAVTAHRSNRSRT